MTENAFQQGWKVLRFDQMAINVNVRTKGARLDLFRFLENCRLRVRSVMPAKAGMIAMGGP